LISRAFFGEKSEAQEFAYIPNEIQSMLQPAKKLSLLTPGHPAAKDDHKFEHLVSTSILDDFCTILAALRIGKSIDDNLTLSVPRQFIIPLLHSSGLLNDENKPVPEKRGIFWKHLPANLLPCCLQVGGIVS